MRHRWAEGQVERFPDLFAELIRGKIDVIVYSSSAATLAAKQATATVPIVFVGVNDPVGTGLVASLAQPGGNITGVASMGPQLGGKRLEVFREAVPHLAHVAFLLEPYNAAAHIQETEVAARAFGITLQSLQVQDPNELDEAFAAMTRERLDGLIVLSDPLILRTGHGSWSLRQRAGYRRYTPRGSTSTPAALWHMGSSDVLTIPHV